MPGPGRTKSKQRAKPTTTRTAAVSSAPDPYLDDIGNARQWKRIVCILCDVFGLPDLSTRSGLKKVHANFELIYGRLDKAYKDNPTNEKLRGGIIGIYAKMCADSILRNKLMNKGLPSKLTPLLDLPSCRHLALNALSTVTRHGGESVRLEIAQMAPVLVRMMQEHPEDPKLAELAIEVISHSVCAVFDGGDNYVPDKKRVGALDLPLLIRVVTDSVGSSTASVDLITHAIGFLCDAALSGAKYIMANSSTLNLLAAALRSHNIVLRCGVVGAFLRLHVHQAEDDQRLLDPRGLIACVQRGFPDDLTDILIEYGFERCETTVMLRTSVKYQKAMMACAQDRDLYALGLTLAGLILSTEFSIADGTFKVESLSGGTYEDYDVGLPFKTWTEALPHCVQALRAKGNLDSADIVHLKYLIIKSRVRDAVQYAKAAIERNPKVAYFYYVITLTAQSADGLRWAKKGMKCKNVTPFVRFQMMQRAVQHAGDIGIDMLWRASVADVGKWEEGVAFLTSALEDSKVYIDDRNGASPDNRHMKNVLYWYIILTITLQGPELSPDLNELKPALEKLKAADGFSRHHGVPPPKTQPRLAQQAIIRLFPEGTKEWGDAISRFDGLDNTPARKEPEDPVFAPETAEDHLAAWLEDMEIGDGSKGHKCSRKEPPLKVNIGRVTLYRCSWCGNPSAALRKCGGCSKTRYCDGGCQKSHWPEHKKICGTI